MEAATVGDDIVAARRPKSMSGNGDYDNGDGCCYTLWTLRKIRERVVNEKKRRKLRLFSFKTDVRYKLEQLFMLEKSKFNSSFNHESFDILCVFTTTTTTNATNVSGLNNINVIVFDTPKEAFEWICTIVKKNKKNL